MYAYDTHLTYADEDVNIIQSCLNEDLLNISKWLIANKLTLNMTKNRLEAKAKHPNYCLPCIERQRYSHTARINVKISGCTNWCKLYMGQSSKGRLKRLPLVLQLSKESDNLLLSNTPSCLQNLDSAAFWLLYFDYCISCTECAESLFVEINRPKEKHIIVGVVYRPPTQELQDFMNTLDLLLASISKESKICYVVGMFFSYWSHVQQG